MRSRSIIALTLAAAAALGTRALAQQKMVLKASDVHSGRLPDRGGHRASRRQARDRDQRAAPFYGVMFAVLMLVTYLPKLSLWLPRTVLR